MRRWIFIFFLLALLSLYFQLVIRSAQVQSFDQLRFYLNGAFFLLIDALLALSATILVYRYGQKKFAAHKYRHIIVYGLSFIVFIVAATGWQLFIELVVFKNPFYLYRYVADFFLRTIFHAVIAVSYITFNLFKEQQHTREVLLQTQKALTESKLQLLQQQLSPHFLFNNLNVLSSLINVENKAAQDYLNHLSKIYRYLIQGSKKEIVSISEEKSFIEDYIYLLKQRFQGAYIFSIADHSIMQIAMVPAYCLQELVINAMKHNETNSQDPLHIDIDFYDSHVTIKNDLRIKKEQPDSLQTGLQNLKDRFKLLTDMPVTINQTDKHFIVTLPTLQLI